MSCKIWILEIFLTLFFPSLAFSWNISTESMQAKAGNPPPTWMQEGIQRDFAFFQDGFSDKDINDCLQSLKWMQGIEVAGLVHFQISSGIIDFKPLYPLSTQQMNDCKAFVNALQKLEDCLSLPSIPFVISFNPSFDRPLLLKETSIPIFAVSKEKHNQKVVLIPRLWDSNRERYPKLFCNWDQKIEKALWRGSSTDGPYGYYDWDCRARAQLALRCRYYPDLFDVAFSALPGDFFIAEWMKSLNLFSSFLTLEDQTLYQYLISIDGGSSPSSFEWQLFTKSVIFKAHSNRIEWFYHALPQSHWISFDPTTNEIIEKLGWLKSHENEAKALAEASYLFAINHLLDEEVLLYFYYVIQSYSKLYM